MNPIELNSYTTKNTHSKYLDTYYTNPIGNYIINPKKFKVVSKEQVEKDRLDDGKNVYVTNDLSLSPAEVSAKYRSLVNIEELFRIMKTTLKTRPFYVSKKESILGLLLINFLALAVMRMVRFVTNGEVAAEQFQNLLNDLHCTESGRRYINIYQPGE